MIASNMNRIGGVAAVVNHKCLMMCVGSSVSALANNAESGLVGTDGYTLTEANAQYQATQEATFSNLGMQVISGNSGGCTLTFRNNGAAGNQTFSLAAGAGVGEDTTNEDVVAAGTPFNVAYTDLGTDSQPSSIKANVEFSSGHGCFHAATNFSGTIFDLESTTQFIGVGGNLIGDGTATNARCAWKNRGYTSIDAMQIRVSANARTTDAVFELCVNGVGTGDTITYAGAATGLQVITGLAVSLADGDLVSISITLGTGVEDLTLVFAGVTMLSSTNKSDCWAQSGPGATRAASSTASYCGIGGGLFTNFPYTEEQSRVKVGFPAVVSNLRVYIGTNNYTGASTATLMVNGIASALTLSITAATGNAWYEDATHTVTIDADDELSIEFDEGTSGTNLQVLMAGVTFAQA